MNDTKYPKLPVDKDRRIKIPKEDHEYIRNAVLKGEVGIREMARRRGVDKRLIQFIVYPERQQINYQHRIARGGSKVYYNKDKWRGVQAEHRRYKKSIQGNELSKWRSETRTDTKKNQLKRGVEKN